MLRLLITGGAGYVGSHVCKAATLAGHECVVFDNLDRGHRAFCRWGRLVEADVRDGAALRATMKQGRFDAVIHLAALAYVGESAEDPASYYDVNVNGTRILLGAMIDAGVPNIVFSSTCAVYGVPTELPITEQSPLNPINPYGFTKMICERMMEDFGRAYGLRSFRLRYFNAAGCDEDCEVGEDHTPETHLIPLVLDAAIGHRRNVTVFGTDYPTPDGAAVRDYVHVVDLADAHLHALRHLTDGGASGAVNLGTGSGSSVLQVIRAAERITGRTILHECAKRRPGDPPELVASGEMSRLLLGWVPKRSELDAILIDAWRWHRQRLGISTS